MKGRGCNNKFGLKRSCSSSSLMQSCPDHCEPPLIVKTHRSCGSSPARCRPPHCHEPAKHCESVDDQMISYTSSCPLKSNDGSQHYHPTRNRYFNALDAAAGIRTALQNSQHSGHCVSKDRSLQRLRLLHPTPTLCSQSNFENCNVEGRCVEDHLPQGLATVLCPKLPRDMEFQIQKRAPRGLASVIADHCSCVESGHQPVVHHCQPCPQLEQCQPCPQRELISLPKLQQFHQEVTSSSPRTSRMTTNIDMLEQIEMPPCESVASSRTSIKMQTDMEQLEQQRLEELQRQEEDDSYLDYNNDELEPALRASSRWDAFGRNPNYDRRSLDWRQGSKRKRSSMRPSNYREPSLRSASFREPSMRPSSVRDASMRSSTFRESSVRSATFREPSRQFDPNEEEILHQQLERMSFNDGQEGFPSDSAEGYSSWVPGLAPDRRSSEPLRLSISVVNESRDPRGQENIEPEDSRRRESNAAGGSSKTSMVSFNQSTSKSSIRGSGSAFPEHLRSSVARSETRETKEVRNSGNFRGIVQQAVHEELSMQKAVQKAVHQELNSRSSYSEEQSSESFSPSCTPDEVQKRSRRPSRASSDEQSAYAQIVANARKSQDILDETEAELASKSRSTSRSKSRVSASKGNGSISTGNADGLARGNSIPLDDESTCESSDQPEYTHRQSQKPPTGITYKDHMASITQLLNSMNSVTQLLNSMPLQGDPDEARKSLERADCSPSRMSAQPLSAPREPSLQTQQHPYRMPAQQSQFDMGAGSPQQPLVQMGGGSFRQSQFDMGARSSQQPLPGMGGGSFQQSQFNDMGARSSQQPLMDMGGGSFQQSQFDRGGGSFQQPQYDFGARGSLQPQFGMGVRNSQQPQFDVREGSFQQSQFGIGAQQPQVGMGASGSSQLQFDQGGGSFQQPQYDMGGRLSQEPQFNSGGQSFQQSQLDMGSMNPNQLPWDMGGGMGQGSYSQLPGQQPGYPNPSGSGPGSIQNWDPNGMPMGSQFGFDPQRPRSQSLPGPQSQFAFDPNYMQRPRSKSMPGGSQFANGWNNTQQSGRRSMGSMNRRPSNSQWRRSSMTDQRRSRRGSTGQNSSMMNEGQRRSMSGSSRQSKRMSLGQRRSSKANSRNDPNEREMKARSSRVLYNPESEAYEEVMEAGEGVSEAIPEADEEEDVEGDEEVQEGDDDQSEDPDHAQESGDSHEQSNDEEGSSSHAEGMAANYQPTIIQSEKLDDQVPQLLQSQVKQLDGTSGSPDLIPTPQPMPEQCDEDVNNPETKTSAQILTKTVDSATPNVAHMPIEFQHHLIRILGHSPQHFEFVKPETYGRKSLSSIVHAMFQELEALESRSRQMSAAYEFSRPSSREYCRQKQLHSDMMVNNQEKLQDHLSPEISS